MGPSHLFWWPFVILWDWQLVGDNATVICARSLSLACFAAEQTTKSCDLLSLGAWPSALAWLDSGGCDCLHIQDWHTGYVAGDLRLLGQTVIRRGQMARCAASNHLKIGCFRGSKSLWPRRHPSASTALLLIFLYFEPHVKETKAVPQSRIPTSSSSALSLASWSSWSSRSQDFHNGLDHQKSFA